MVEAGGASPLASMLAGSGAGNAEVATAVLECLAQLTDAGLPQTQGAVRNAGAVPQLIQLMSHQNSRISSAASSLIATLCPGDVQASEQLYEAGRHRDVSRAAQSPSEGAQLQAVSALSQLSAAPRSRKRSSTTAASARCSASSTIRMPSSSLMQQSASATCAPRAPSRPPSYSTRACYPTSCGCSPRRMRSQRAPPPPRSPRCAGSRTSASRCTTSADCRRSRLCCSPTQTRHTTRCRPSLSSPLTSATDRSSLR